MKWFLVALVICPVLFFSQIPTGYYSSVSGLSGNNLMIGLHQVIKAHTQIPYTNLWTAFEKTDAQANGKVWDIYGYVPGGPQQYQYDFVTMQCGTYVMEGDCFEREHLWPQAWYNGFGPADSDLFNVYPTDGFVKSKRGIDPFGTALLVSYMSFCGNRSGACADAGYSGNIFEPINEFKGDIARSYFYMTTRYYTEDLTWASSPATNKSTILPWQLSVLMFWHRYDPVSAKEIARNDSIYYLFQHNRNPFIDHPEYADNIWSAYIGMDEFDMDKKENYSLFPNPSENGIVTIAGLHQGNKVEVYNTLGQLVFSAYKKNELMSMDLSSFPSGVYMVNIKTKHAVHSYKLVNAHQ